MNYRIKDSISLVAGLLIAVTFIASGTGKLFGDMQTPAQIMAFINAVLPEAFLTPLFIDFIYKILVPVVFPWAELILGIALLIGLIPRFAAVLTLPMIAAFMGTNIWTIITGEYSHCASCFGIWEKIFGYLTPYQSLGIDIILGLLALAVIFLQPGRFFSNRWPVTRLAGLFLPGQKGEEKEPVLLPGTDKRLRPVDSVDRFLIYVRRNIWSVAGYVLGVVGIILILIAALISALPVNNNSNSSSSPVADNITVTDMTTSSGIVNFTTSVDEAVDIIVYDKDGKITGLFSDLGPVKNHSIKADNLYPATTYYFQLLSGYSTTGKRLSGKFSFTTLEPPPVISNVSISTTTDSAAVITWETDRPTNTEVTYGEEGNAERKTIIDDASNASHEATLQPLDRERVYAFVIRARDAYGHQLIAEYEGVLSLKTGVQLTQRAPDFALPTVTGDILKFSQYRGKVVLLVFWNMTCPACQKKMPLLQKAFEREDSDKVAIITVHGPGRETAIKSYCSSQGLTLPVLLDLNAEVGSSYNVLQLPATFVLDQSGVIRSIDPGLETQEDFDRLFNQFLSK
ncbi:MAG: redoxin domain-containing protein [Chloroflexi bacterium]|nr:redoxin domain-containing protein [Chloroflexota bacterium]